MPQPLPRMQWVHHTPGFLSKSMTAMTLQHSVHVPHSRPGTTCLSAAAGSSLVNSRGASVVIPAPDRHPLHYGPARALSSLESGDVRASRLDIDRIERLARSHEQAVALRSAKADVRANLGQADLADPCAVRREDVHAIVAVADPAGARPHVAVLVAADAVGESGLAVPLHVDEGLRILQRLSLDVVDPPLALRLRIVRDACVGDVQLAIVLAEAEPVWLERFLRDLGDRAALVDAVDRFLAQRTRRRGALRQPVALVLHQRTVARIGEPDRAVVRMYHRIVRRVEFLSLELVSDNRHLAVVLVAHHLARAVLAGDLAPLVVKRVAVAVARGIAEAPRDVIVLLEITQVLIVRDVAPDEIT